MMSTKGPRVPLPEFCFPLAVEEVPTNAVDTANNQDPTAERCTTLVPQQHKDSQSTPMSERPKSPLAAQSQRLKKPSNCSSSWTLTDNTLQNHGPSLPPLHMPQVHTPPSEYAANNTPNPSPHQTILDTARSSNTTSRFFHLLTHTELLIRTQGSYYTNPFNAILRANIPTPTLTPSRFARSLAAVQDALAKAQPLGPVFYDLQIFVQLWETTTTLLYRILDSHELGLVAFGHGVLGLAAGYLAADAYMQKLKERLAAALASLPALHAEPGTLNAQRGPGNAQHLARGGAVKLTPRGQLHTTTTANRTVHICAHLLMQDMRRDWGRVRWAHGVRVVQAWLGHLEWKGEESGSQTGPRWWDSHAKGVWDYGRKPRRPKMHARSVSDGI